jgi:hypothetical protein
MASKWTVHYTIPGINGIQTGETHEFDDSNTVTEVVGAHFESLPSQRPDIDWEHMYVTHGDDLGTQIVYIEEVQKSSLGTRTVIHTKW